MSPLLHRENALRLSTWYIIVSHIRRMYICIRFFFFLYFMHSSSSIGGHTGYVSIPSPRRLARVHRSRQLITSRGRTSYGEMLEYSYVCITTSGNIEILHGSNCTTDRSSSIIGVLKHDLQICTSIRRQYARTHQV